MSKNFNQKAERGSVINTILEVLQNGDKYGYEIIKEVEAKTGVILKQPSLYSCLTRLENQGLISSYWTDSDIGGRRHYYKLTELGNSNQGADLEDDEEDNSSVDPTFNNEEIEENEEINEIVKENPNHPHENPSSIHENTQTTENLTNKFDEPTDFAEIIKDMQSHANLQEQNVQNEEPVEEMVKPIEQPEEIKPMENLNNNSFENFQMNQTNSCEENNEPSENNIQPDFDNIPTEQSSEEEIENYSAEIEEVKNSTPSTSDDVNYKEILGDFLKEDEVEPEQNTQDVVPDHNFSSEQQSFDLSSVTQQIKSDKKYINNILLKPAIKEETIQKTSKEEQNNNETLNNFAELTSKMKDENISVKPYLSDEYISVNKNRYIKNSVCCLLNVLLVVALSLFVAFAKTTGLAFVLSVVTLMIYSFELLINFLNLIFNVGNIKVYKKHMLIVPVCVVVILNIALLLTKPSLYNALMFLIPSALILVKAFAKKLLAKK